MNLFGICLELLFVWKFNYCYNQEIFRNLQNLQALIFKQRKAKMLQDIKSGRYKILFKNEAAINEEFQNEQILHDYLKYVMERTSQDFPLLKNNIQKILLTLEIL